MYLIVGLGNPEEDYSNTRHNMGFDTINKLGKQYGIEINKSKFKGLYETGIIENQKVILLKPQTFMNLSGESIREAIDFYKSHIDLKQDVDQFAPIIKAIIENTMNVYHERLNRNIFKLATEVGVNSLFLSKMVEIDKDTYEKVRLMVVDEVKRTKGTMSLYDAQDKK